MREMVKGFNVLVVAVAIGATFAVGCSSTTMIRTNVPAKVYLNGEYVGNTPYAMTDTKIVGSTTTVRLEAPGYQTVNGAISRSEEFSVGACIGGVFLLVPFLWIMDYKPDHYFEMQPGAGAPAPAPAPPPGV